MIVSTNGAKVAPPEKQDTVSINSENTKDFDTASFSVNGDEPPPAYRKPTRAAVQVARVVAVTVVAVALILGAAIVLAAWIQTRNQTTTTEITVEAPIVPENGALISERVNASNESTEKDGKGQRRLDEGNELESGEVDASPLITVIKLPLDVNFGDITDDMLNFKNNGNKNCYVEKKKIEDFGENPLKNLSQLLGLNVTEDAIKIVGEKVVMICDETPKPNPFGGIMAPPMAPLFPMPRLDGRLLPFPFQRPPRPSPFSLNLNPFFAQSQPPFPRNDVIVNTVPLKLPFPFNPRPDNAPFPRMNRFPPAFAASLSLESVSDEDDSEESDEESDEELSPRPSLPRLTPRLNNLLLNRPTNNNNNNIQGRRFENARRSFDRPNFGRPLEDPEARKFSSSRPSNPFQALVNSFMEQTRMRLPLSPNRRVENPGIFAGPNRPQVNRPIPVREPIAPVAESKMAEERFANMQLPPRVPATAIPQVPRQFAPPVPPSFNPANAQMQAAMVAPPVPARQPNLPAAEPPMITRNARFLQHPQPLPSHRPGVFPQQRALETEFIQPR